ncbi:MAG: methyltransferase domain-containing protein [Ktedonobacterales bacterium]|nr:methyltransferase domain-containing protein [Ktedonobacterales bacterium]
MSESDTGSYRIREVSRSMEKELERLRVQTILGWEKESRALRHFGLRDGMSVLEVGMGPGFVTEQLLALLPHSVITGVDFDPVMVETAEQQLRYMRGDRVQLVHGSIMQMPLPDDSYDFALARFLFQHLPDPVGAAREVLRVLKPGGIFAIHDVDAEVGGLGEPAMSPEMMEILTRADTLQTRQGGNTKIGRQLPRILKQAGFAQLDMDIMLVHSDIVGMERMAILWDEERLWPALKAGIITQADFDRVRVDLAAYRANPASLEAYTLLFAKGMKPE